MVTEHVHNPWLCPKHSDGCGVTPCNCQEQGYDICNPYWLSGFCPDDLERMPEAASDSPAAG